MIGRSYDHDMAGQGINLQQQRTDHALDLTRFMDIAALFAKRIKLVEKQDALVRPYKVEQLLQASTGLAQEAANDSLVAHNE